MSVERIDNNENFQCASIDDIPTGMYSKGSTMHIISTGEILVYYEGMWLPDLRSARAIINAQFLK